MFSWLFRRKGRLTLSATTVFLEEGVATIDVRGQTCPGYLLAINKVVESLPVGTTAKLLISYPPCSDDVGAWCTARSVEYVGISQQEGVWIIEIRK